MDFGKVAGPPRRDPLFLSLCVFTLVIAEMAQRGVFAGTIMARLANATQEAQGLNWMLLGPLAGGILALLIGRHLGLALGGISLLLGALYLAPMIPSAFGLGAVALGYGLLGPCLLTLAAVWLPNERGNARLALFFLFAIGSHLTMMAMPTIATDDSAGLSLAAFAALALLCAFGLAALDFWAGRGYDPPRSEEKAPSPSQWQAVALLVATGILCHTALGAAYQQQYQVLQAWMSQSQQFGWLTTMTSMLGLALLVVGLLLALMGTFMGLPRLGLGTAIPFALGMGALAVLCGSLASGEGEPRVAVALFAAIATGFLQMAQLPLLSAAAGLLSPRWTPLVLGLYLGLGGPVFGRPLGQTVAGLGSSGIYPFAFLLIAAAVAGHLLGRRADRNEEPKAAI